MEQEYTARECVEYAISCLKNRDSRGCTIKWLVRALGKLDDDGERVDAPAILRELVEAAVGGFIDVASNGMFRSVMPRFQSALDAARAHVANASSADAPTERPAWNNYGQSNSGIEPHCNYPVGDCVCLSRPNSYCDNCGRGNPRSK